ncbi:MAG TPA: bifunctional aspartate kinase/homoserine dehydrogenase I [Candidatus Polarisedimenticolaceae bacterium]|nr:bifunctional aspartate kinase/homoserine dehydrogenase I [Candidatus Polarisedimenticolaceae bacterium]
MAAGWVVHKFGGTSLAGAERYRAAARLVPPAAGRRQAIVVSAMAGVTDTLLRAVQLAGARDTGYRAELAGLRRRHLEVLGELLPRVAADALVARLETDLDDVEDLLRAVWLLHSGPSAVADVVAGYGEVWSAQILAAHLAVEGRESAWLDARQVLVVEPGERAPSVLWEPTRVRIGEWLAAHAEPSIVVTGFVAATAAGVPTTLGRNGSDYSAAIFGALLGAQSITIWTDVDGVLSADPRQVPDAVVLDTLSYDEAMELAYFGAKVIHPATLAPAVDQAIPLYIRNTFRPEAPGTRIDATGGGAAQPVKGFATIGQMALINVEGTGLIGVPGIAERLFGALRGAGVSVVMISQGSSEHSICFAVPAAQAEPAQSAVERAFAPERRAGQLQAVTRAPDCAILALVGDGMAGVPGIAAKFFGALGKAGVNVRAIAQGSSERNISVVIDGRESTRALRAVHAGFYLSNQTLSIGLIGPGLVGSTLLAQLAGQRERLRTELKIDLRLRAIAGSQRMLLEERELDPDDWRARLDGAAEPADLERFLDHVQSDAIPHAVVVDCSASEEIARRHAAWLERGIHVVTPNKKAKAGELDYARRLREAGRSSRMHYLYETTVGAGLPVIQTLRDLIQTGDEIRSIEGILSGTLSYLFNSFDGRRGFSQLVREARSRGYTEPDPRDDLSGMDVARKVLILAREMGLELELSDLRVDSLVPSGLEAGSVDEFLAALERHDAEMNGLLEQARAAGEVLRFVGRVDPGGRSAVRLERYPATHPFGRIQLTDNVVQFRTRRYDDNPLVIQGPGAGPEVTAAGIFADLLRLATYLGATL